MTYEKEGKFLTADRKGKGRAIPPKEIVAPELSFPGLYLVHPGGVLNLGNAIRAEVRVTWAWPGEAFKMRSRRRKALKCLAECMAGRRGWERAEQGSGVGELADSRI